MTSLHDFTLQTIDGETRSLSDYEGKVVLLVNVASQCGLTPQYAGLQTLHETYGERGLAVLGVPCNQFKGQEPGTEAEIKAFCVANYGVSFPLFAKLEVNGPGRHALYSWLTSLDASPEGAGDIQWNFGKFVLGKDGAVLGRFGPMTELADEALVALIEGAL